MSLPALPSAQSITPAELADYGGQVVAWAEQIEDVAEVREMSDKWAGIIEYARRKSKDGIAQAEAALRRLELRVSALTETAPVGRPPETASAQAISDRNERSYLNQIREHPEIVERVIAESTDDSPPSRRKVITAIRDTRVRQDIDAELAEAREHAPALRSAIAALPDESRTYLVTIRIKSHPDFLERRLPIGFEVVAITEETNVA